MRIKAVNSLFLYISAAILMPMAVILATTHRSVVYYLLFAVSLLILTSTMLSTSKRKFDLSDIMVRICIEAEAMPVTAAVVRYSSCFFILFAD